MAIKITNFGGLVPKAEPRALPDDAAQVAEDLLPGTREFRPSGQDTVAVANTGVPNPKTIYRLARTAGGAFNTDMTTGWIVKAGEMSFVKGQINDDTTERTFATFDNGLTPPRVYDASDTVTGRQLGVPAPTDAPALTVNVIAQFSTDDRSAAITAAQTYLKNISKVVADPLWKGSPSDDPVDYRPGFTHDGYVDRDYVPGIDPQEAQQLRVFRIGSTGGAFSGAMSDTYDSAHDVSYYQWVLDPQLGGFYQTSPTVISGYEWPPWAGTNQDHWCIPFAAYGLTYVLDDSSLTTYLDAMEKPGEETTTALLSSGQRDEIITAINDMLDAKKSAVQPKLTALKAGVATMYSLLGAGGVAQRENALAGFYGQSDVSDEIDSAIANLAEQLWGLTQQANAYQDFSMPGGGP